MVHAIHGPAGPRVGTDGPNFGHLYLARVGRGSILAHGHPTHLSRRVLPAAGDAERAHARGLERSVRAVIRTCRAEGRGAAREGRGAGSIGRRASGSGWRSRRCALAEPSWVDDPGFDIATHVTALGEPGVPLTLARFGQLTDSDAVRAARPRRGRCGSCISCHGLEDGRAGLIFKMHHALVDGKSAVELALLLFDLEPDPGPEPPAAWPPATTAERRTTGARRVRQQRGRAAARGAGMARLAAGRARRTHRHAAARRARVRAGPAALGPGLLPERADRPAAHARPPPGATWPTLLEAKRRPSVTVNDVCLRRSPGRCGGWLACGARARGRCVMVRSACAARRPAPDLGNRISFAFIELPVATRSRAERLGGARATRFKTPAAPPARARCSGAIGLLPDPVKNRAARHRLERACLQPHDLQHPGPAVPASTCSERS